MNYYQKHRALYPDDIFETRALPEIDGVTRLVTMSSSYWKKLEIYSQETSNNVENIVRFCLDYAKIKHEKYHSNFDKAFNQGFRYYIYIGYAKIYKRKNNIANDFWKL